MAEKQRTRTRSRAKAKAEDTEEKKDGAQEDGGGGSSRSGRNRNTKQIPDDQKKKMMIGGGCAFGALILFLIFSSGGSDNTTVSGEQALNEMTTTATAAPTQALSSDEQFQQELANQGIGSDAVNQIGSGQTMVESDTFVKDIYGNDVPEIFTMEASSLLKDEMMSYTKHRAILDDGSEMYWLEGDYKGYEVRATIPYKYYESLSESGVMDCRVEFVKTAPTAENPEGGVLITWVDPLLPDNLYK